ncbi:MAG: S41 family peptidase [Deltaproteobacteria bacterium]|nr:S41 family peptidase [Deltaproteobacteria bacterium]
MRRRHVAWLRFGGIALATLLGFAFGIAFSQPLQAGRFDPYRKLGVFTKVLSYIETSYVENISESELIYGAARGLTDVLDPHTRFMDPEEYDRLRNETEGNAEIEGIGIDLEKRKSGLVVVSPIEGSPAFAAGIAPGDVIIKIDGTATADMDWGAAIGRIQGPPGSRVVLTVDRGGKEKVFEIVRKKFEVKTVEGRIIAPGYGYVKIRIFSSNTDEKLVEAMDRIQAEVQQVAKSKAAGTLRGLVLDMRRNPGGLLDQGVKVADRFLSEGLIVRTVGKGGREMDRQIAHSRGTYSGFPIVVLVDGATASAAEIVAGALQDHKRAVVMGQQTFGKGSVQTVFSLDGCGAKPCGLKITVSRYYTPSGRSIQNHGITPNIHVSPQPPPRTEEEGPRERDFERHLQNDETPEHAEAQLADYPLQVALDYLRSFEILAGQKL